MATVLARNLKEPPADARQVRSRGALTAALLALLEERSFDQITIRAISARAGTGYATFFRHYPDKETLLADVASAEIAGLLDRAIPILNAVDGFESTQALCAYVADDRRLWSALLIGGAAGIVRQEFIRQARALNTDGTSVQDWLPADLGVVYGAGATIDLLAWWLAQPDELSPERVATILYRLIIAPLVGDRALPE